MSSAVCQICDYTINVSTRKCVSCPYCSFDACRTCCETYLLNESVPKCMNTSCNREWTRPFTNSAFTGIFINKKYKKHREQILFDQERALLPVTQIVVENIIRCENIDKKNIEIVIKIKTLQRQRNLLLLEKAQITDNPNGTKTERHEFIKACPDTNCRGFLSSHWKCGVCEKWACPSCHEVKGITKDAEHTCNPDTIATVSLLSHDTKNCPKCQMGIYKIDGCDQMWCTQCHTAFNWRTNKIENTVHNPHYFEWLRRNGDVVPRNPGDVPCQDNLSHNHQIMIQNLLRTKHANHPLRKTCEITMSDIIRCALHLRHVVLIQYRQTNYVERNMQLRVLYMRNRITEEKFRTDLQRNEKRNQKKNDMRNVLTILLTTVTDIVFRFIEHLNIVQRNQFNLVILDEMNVIVAYVNECLYDIAFTYSSKIYKFSNTLEEI